MIHKLLCCCAVLAMGTIFPAVYASCRETANAPAGPESLSNDTKCHESQADQHAEAAIEAAVAKPTQFDFDETPLKDVIGALKAKYQIEIQMDHKALDDVGVSSDVPVTSHIKDLTLRAALNLMLKELELVWIVDNEVLLITTPEVADSKLITRVYDVADLVACRDSKGNLCDDYQMLTDAIKSTIAPSTWDTVPSPFGIGGGPANVSVGSLGTARVLIISQAYHVHREIATLLADIRAVAAKKSSGTELPRRDPSPPGPIVGLFAGQVSTAAAEKAKAALLEMIEANKADLKEDFSPEKMGELRQTSPERDATPDLSRYQWGPFGIDLKTGTYSALKGNAIAMRVYSGKFSVSKEGKWTAEKPSVQFMDSLPRAK